jgi:hypothetical protein
MKDCERDVQVGKNAKVYFKWGWNKSPFDSVVFHFDDFFIEVPEPGGIIYMCVRDIEFTYLYDFSIECWNCSDSVLRQSFNGRATVADKV